MKKRPADKHKSWAWDIANDPENYPPISIEKCMAAYDVWRWELPQKLIDRAIALNLLPDPNKVDDDA